MSYIGNQPTSVAFLTDSFSGTGSQTAFTMSVAPANPAAALVSVSGVVQDPSTYAVSGTTLTFSAAPPAGTGNISVRYLGVPASNIATTAFRTQTEFTATAGQTTFTPASYNVGFIDVYRNGVLLGSADYTATNGTTVVLATACVAGEFIETVSFFVSSVLNAIPATPGAVTSTYIQNTPVLTTPTLNSPTFAGTMTGSVITSGTAVASTSGTSIDFTSIPSWVKRVTVMLQGVSTNGTSNLLVQVGAGSVTTSGYLGSANALNFTTGFSDGLSGASVTRFGTYVIQTLGSNVWNCSVTIGSGGTNPTNTPGGFGVTLGGTLDRVRITTVNGTDTFDAGSINILYE